MLRLTQTTAHKLQLVLCHLAASPMHTPMPGSHVTGALRPVPRVYPYDYFIHVFLPLNPPRLLVRRAILTRSFARSRPAKKRQPPR